MHEHNKVEIIDSSEPQIDDECAVPDLLHSILKSSHKKKEKHQSKKRESGKKKKKKKKRGNKKEERVQTLVEYDEYFDNYDNLDYDALDPFMREQSRLREGNVIPDELKLGLYDESGFFVGMKCEHNVFIGKPSHYDGHIKVMSPPGSGKTQASVIPTMMTWRGSQIIIDVKGNLYNYWLLLNKHTGKKVKVFDPESPRGASYGYDPYAPLRHGGVENIPGNARDLALALMPLLPSNKEPIWIQATQNFLTGAIIYFFGIGLSFIETMAEVQNGTVLDIIEEIREDDNISARFYINKLNDVQDKVVGNIGMELSNLAALITDPMILSVICSDTVCGQIDWADYITATEPCDVILVFRESYMERLEPLMKLMVNQLIKSLEQRPERTYRQDKNLPPLLVMLDEFPRLGKISAIKSGLQTLRSRGVTFALFMQSLADLEDTYGSTTARVIADICGYTVIFNAVDAASQEYLSKIVGTTESTQRGVSAAHDPFSGRVNSYNRSINETREFIIHPHEFLTQKDVIFVNPLGGFCRVKKIIFAENKKVFLRPQLLKNQDYTAQNPIYYEYNV